MSTNVALEEFPLDATSTAWFYNTEYLQTLRHQMLKFAALQLGDAHLAEDAVQEALMGALKNASLFGGKAALKTWVFAILKNKMADILRQRRRQLETGSLVGEEGSGESNAVFDSQGVWRPADRPLEWSDPEASFKQQQFWTVFETCLESLPTRQAKIFIMREVMGMSTGEICDSEAISMTNLHVLLHRARLRLRECLENQWYGIPQ